MKYCNGDKMGKKYYAVKVGEKIGIYNSWDECKKNVHGFPGAVYKSFASKEEAELFIYGKNNENLSNNSFRDINDIDENIKALKDGELIAFVDGSFNAKTKTYGYGAAVYSNKWIKEFNGSNDEYEELAEMRNVAGELMGVIAVVKLAIDMCMKSIKIYYDYTGIEAWANNNWKTNKKFTKFYAEYIKKSRENIEIDFIKVKAHSGVKYNELVDKLAKKAVGLDGL